MNGREHQRLPPDPRRSRARHHRVPGAEMTAALVILLLLAIGAGINVLWRFSWFNFWDWVDRRKEDER